MVQACYQFGHYAFQFFLTFLRDRILYPEKQVQIYMVSPWFHDINFSDLSLRIQITNFIQTANLQPEDILNVYSIIETAYKRIDRPENFKLNIITSIYNGNHIPKSNEKQNTKEALFLKNLLNLNSNVQVFFHRDLHAKILFSNGLSLSGSANITPSGFFKHAENVHLYFPDNEDYSRDFKRIQDILLEAKHFKENRDDIIKYIEKYVKK